MRRPWAVPLALFLTLLAGCSSPEGDSARSGTTASPSATTVAATSGAPTTDVPTVEAPTATASSTGPPPNAGPVHQLGDRARLVTGSTATVFAWRPVQRPGRAAAGAWWAADVKVCLTRSFGDGFHEPVGNFRSQFRAELADDTALTPEGDARRADEVYAQTREAFAGKCLRGDVVFDVPKEPAARYFAITISPFSWSRWHLS